jgi:hypothetical protein
LERTGIIATPHPIDGSSELPHYDSGSVFEDEKVQLYVKFSIRGYTSGHEIVAQNT